MTDRQKIKLLEEELSFDKSVIARQNTEIARLKVEQEELKSTITNLRAEIKYLKRITANRCGTCMYAKPVERPGKTTIWVQCTNVEHIKKYCTTHEGTKYRPKYTHACKSYQERKEE